jgi:retron-type reverse transcriptase
LKAGINPEFPTQGTPQGGVVSPLLANIALNGIEALGKGIRYADDCVFILKPEDNADKLQAKIAEFLAKRGMNVSQKKTKITAATDGFDFLGWHFKVQANGKFKSYPSEDNYKKFRDKVKDIVNNSNLGAKVAVHESCHDYIHMSNSKE